jgi:hypothetical protein
MVRGHVTGGDISLNHPKVYRQEDNTDKTRHETHDNQSTTQQCIKILQIDTEYYMDTAIL